MSIDAEALRREALGQLGLPAMDPRWPGRVLTLLDQLAAAEHRATRADVRIQAVQDVLEESEARGPVGMTFNGTPFPAWISIAAIRRALDG